MKIINVDTPVGARIASLFSAVHIILGESVRGCANFLIDNQNDAFIFDAFLSESFIYIKVVAALYESILVDIGDLIDEHIFHDTADGLAAVYCDLD